MAESRPFTIREWLMAGLTFVSLFIALNTLVSAPGKQAAALSERITSLETSMKPLCGITEKVATVDTKLGMISDDIKTLSRKFDDHISKGK